MRILVVGAGAIGGYFGGRLLEAGRDVTFLVRPRRHEQLARTGLVIRSAFGDVALPSPLTVMADTLDEAFDLVLLSCKAYDLADAMESFAPAVGEGTAILPLLNGMGHLDALEARFGAGRVLGGQCRISAALDDEGRILHLNESHSVSFGERDGVRSQRAEAILSTLTGARFDVRLSEEILQEMWEKWVFIATGAGSTCLMRATVGDVVEAGAADFVNALVDECAAIATANGFPPSEAALAGSRTTFTRPGSPLTASMFRDIESGAPTEGDHVIGDLLRRGRPEPGASPVLRLVNAHLRAYEARRKRERADPRPAPR